MTYQCAKHLEARSSWNILHSNDKSLPNRLYASNMSWGDEKVNSQLNAQKMTVIEGTHFSCPCAGCKLVINPIQTCYFQ